MANEIEIKNWKKTGLKTHAGKMSNATTLQQTLCVYAVVFKLNIRWLVAVQKNSGNLVNEEDYVNCLGAVTGGQAVQQVKAGVKAIYLSGWQVAADGNTSETMYPDQSLYAVDSVPTMVRRINNAFKRADEIQCSKGSG